MPFSFEELREEVKSFNAPEGVAGTIASILKESVENGSGGSITNGKPRVKPNNGYLELMLKIGMVYQSGEDWLLSEKALRTYEAFHQKGYYGKD
jgi:hypothetical protein